MVPLHGLDDLWYYQGAIFHVLFVFDDVLDPPVLHDSLETLVKQEGWQKLGARLRKVGFSPSGTTSDYLPISAFPPK